MGTARARGGIGHLSGVQRQVSKRGAVLALLVL